MTVNTAHQPRSHGTSKAQSDRTSCDPCVGGAVVDGWSWRRRGVLALRAQGSEGEGVGSRCSGTGSESSQHWHGGGHGRLGGGARRQRAAPGQLEEAPGSSPGTERCGQLRKVRAFLQSTAASHKRTTRS